MVGLMAFAGLRDRVQHVTSHDSGNTDERSVDSSGFALIRRHVPFIASPLDPKTSDWLQGKHATNNLTLMRRPTVAQQEASRVSGGIFRKQKEASPLELFFDLFFVANLAIYSYNHSSSTAESVGNFIGFFSLMWTFWFHVALHDVRFYVDSVLNRFLKLVQFGLFTAFTGLGPLYNVLSHENNETESRSFGGLALVFMVSRLVFMLQYGVVLWYVRPFKKAILPLALMMLIYLCSAMAFLGSYIQAHNRALNPTEGLHHVIVWYATIGIEAIAVILVSSIWRILSFKRTHLVERVGLLTLIIMGEGIIGVIKSASAILDGSSVDVWEATGIVISSVFFIYLIFVLYFTPIAHDRFGTIRQQVWVLLHYPLHVAILLSEEGSAETMLWTTIIGARRILINAFPNLLEPSHGYETIDDLITKVNNTMTATADGYRYLDLREVYNWLPDLDRIRNLTEEFTYASEEFNEHAGEIMGEMVNETTNYFFENFQFEGPAFITSLTDTNEILATYYDSYTVIYTCFYVSAGVLLLALAAMFWIGKNNKKPEEWLNIVARIVVGAALIPVTAAAYTQPWETGFMFSEAGWIVSVAVFCYLAVSIADNVVQNLCDRRLQRQISRGELEAGDLEDSYKRRFNGAFGPNAPVSPNRSSVNLATVSHDKGVTDKSKTIHFEEPSTKTTGESSGNNSDSPTLNGRRESEKVQYLHPSSAAAAPPPPTPRAQNNQQQEWPLPESQLHPQPPSHQQRDNPYRIPSFGPTIQGYGRLNTNADADTDTSYHGHSGMLGDAERERESENRYRNDDSFEQERMMSPVSYTDQHLGRPEQGHHIPEQDRTR